MNETTAKALDNLKAIKAGQDPRDSKPKKNRDPLSTLRDEVDRLWEEYSLEDYVPRERIHCGTALWDRKNGKAKYDHRLSGEVFNKKVTGFVRATGSHCIIVNADILRQGNLDGFIDTTRHEVAHIIDYIDAAYNPHGVSSGHGQPWKAWARRLGADPKSCHNKRDADYNYYYGCSNGCWSVGRFRRSKKIKYAEHYTCSRCGSNCTSWEV